MELQETYEVTGPQLDGLGALEDKLPPAARKAPSGVLAILLCVLIALFGMGGIKLKAAQASAAKQYTVCTLSDSFGHTADSIFDLLGERQDAAANLIGIAARELGETDPLVSNAKNALSAATLGKSPAQDYAGDAALETALTALYQALPENRAAAGQWEEFSSLGGIISHNPYNQFAESWNRSIGGFPSGLIGLLWGGGKVELYA